MSTLTLSEALDKNRVTFPVLAIYKTPSTEVSFIGDEEFVVLFTAPHTGEVVSHFSKRSRKYGTQSFDWIHDAFRLTSMEDRLAIARKNVNALRKQGYYHTSSGKKFYKHENALMSEFFYLKRIDQEPPKEEKPSRLEETKGEVELLQQLHYELDQLLEAAVELESKLEEITKRSANGLVLATNRLKEMGVFKGD